MTDKIINTGKIFTGVVVSDKMTNTIVVSLSYTTRHSLYKKIIKKNKKIYADNNLKAKMGDTVKVRETRPLSKLKRFTTLEIIKSAIID
ncbi:MAG: 30S ribosomal protein S17 [Candidatus Shapirobacteria bacterium GW2011_GWE1_38_10]|uniref:Small ribosomal subunit protein uS17 n=1 Tax=Candidatus Shapirobacteria bacterium GW2011_GWE1_38_10 TaxID=1618488 RepID=A0A0G0IGN9_9BACT|nr:MAG: 30S ribosomal protein S17 [Candidatus Shapirobacteria bacterium GW2011_GWF2_37_20]KKQ50150.1 MAG: 30S ribosomal protein S17 [Candidatus Shapirobacteria bacterium GW2011_GWE1_38_10]KKQ64743.1 MAG: 30S ribosomal protein S17 [Candidatus Shapirobacteria bacterium GW2011_GWF1_38_23]HBP50899.1 30S ribosomal protein S17 [Candidatus Shapirobacteria bacterium]